MFVYHIFAFALVCYSKQAQTRKSVISFLESKAMLLISHSQHLSAAGQIAPLPETSLSCPATYFCRFDVAPSRVSKISCLWDIGIMRFRSWAPSEVRAFIKVTSPKTMFEILSIAEV